MDYEEILNVCSGERDAASLILQFWNLCEVWDDAIDGQQNEPVEDIHRAFLWALFDLPQNAFYASRPALKVAMQTCIANWMAANQLEASGDPDKLYTAYTLRCAPYDFFVAVVLEASGFEVAQQFAATLRGTTSGDNFQSYLREHLKGTDHGMVVEAVGAAGT